MFNKSAVYLIVICVLAMMQNSEILKNRLYSSYLKDETGSHILGVKLGENTLENDAVSVFATMSNVNVTNFDKNKIIINTTGLLWNEMDLDVANEIVNTINIEQNITSDTTFDTTEDTINTSDVDEIFNTLNTTGVISVDENNTNDTNTTTADTTNNTTGNDTMTTDVTSNTSDDTVTNNTNSNTIDITNNNNLILEVQNTKIIKKGDFIDTKSLILEATNLSTGEDLKDKVAITGKVDNSKIGAYQIYYSLTDDEGNNVKSKSVVTVTGENSVLIGDVVIDAYDFSISTSDVMTLTDKQIIDKSGLRTWSVLTGIELADKIVIDRKDLKNIAGKYEIAFRVDMLKAQPGTDALGNDAAVIVVTVNNVYGGAPNNNATNNSTNTLPQTAENYSSDKSYYKLTINIIFCILDILNFKLSNRIIF